jgi:hypothetical protein
MNWVSDLAEGTNSVICGLGATIRRALSLVPNPQSPLLPRPINDLPHGLAQLPEKLGRSGVAASRAW